MKRPNAWHAAIMEQLRIAGGALTVRQIWERLAAVNFQHASKAPRSTLGARVAELAQLKVLERVGPATYRLSPTLSLRVETSSQEPPQEIQAGPGGIHGGVELSSGVEVSS